MEFGLKKSEIKKIENSLILTHKFCGMVKRITDGKLMSIPGLFILACKAGKKEEVFWLYYTYSNLIKELQDNEPTILMEISEDVCQQGYLEIAEFLFQKFPFFFIIGASNCHKKCENLTEEMKKLLITIFDSI